MRKLTEISFKIAKTTQDFKDGVSIFQQYANSINIDLSFQDFANELKTIHKQYGKPKGALLLAYSGTQAVGCVGIRELNSGIAELKRMFVQTEYRGHKIGEKMLEQIINVAKQLNYKAMRLDTLPTMTQAQSLYYSYGFYKIPAYRFNPIKGTVFMEKKLM